MSQGPIGKDLLTTYTSRTLNSHEKNYSVLQIELLAIVWATSQFRPHIFRRKFKYVTVHKPISYLFKVKDPRFRLARWRFDEYDCEIVYKPGKHNVNADAFSRINDSDDSDIETKNKRLADIQNINHLKNIVEIYYGENQEEYFEYQNNDEDRINNVH